jgi:beta-glucosidase
MSAMKMLKANEKKTVTFRLGVKDLAYWNVGRHRWETEKDQIKIVVGGSSVDERVTGRVKVL